MPRAATITERDATRDALNLAWLIRLRFVAVAGQLVAVLVAHHLLGVPLPIRWVMALIAVGLASNVSLAVWARRGAAPGGGALAGVIAFDVWLLTGLLYLTGGPFNPFSFVYLVYISLATEGHGDHGHDDHGHDHGNGKAHA